MEEVALIFHAIEAAEEPRFALFLGDARVVAGGDEARAEAIGEREELAQLHRSVAGHARARRLAGEVGVDEGIDHVLLEELAAIEGEVRDVEVNGDAAGVVLVLRSAAAAADAAVVRVVPEVERHAHDVVALVEQAGRRDGGVHPAAHCYQDTRLAHRRPA